MSKLLFRNCPECGEPGVDVKEVYPHGTSCKLCLKHIEVNMTAIFLIIGSLLGVMFWDLRFYETGIGLIAALALIYIGAFSHQVYPNFMPLRHYDDE